MQDDLKSSMIDGHFVMRDHIIPGYDEATLAQHMWDHMHVEDWAHRSIDELSPNSFPAYRA